MPALNQSDREPLALTVATAVGKSPLTKVFHRTPDGSYSAPKVLPPRRCTYRTETFVGLTGLLSVLQRLELDRRSCVLMGEPVPGLDLTKPHRRLLHDRTEDDGSVSRATLRDAGRAWIAFDLDKVPWPDGLNPLEHTDACIQAAREQVPPECATVSCIVQFTSNHGIKPTPRMRLWFILDRPIEKSERQAWASHRDKVDPASFIASQPIFTATPVFEDMTDPVACRYLISPGQVDVVAVPPRQVLLSAATHTPVTGAARIPRLAGNGWRSGLRLLGDGEGRLGGHDPCKTIINAYVEQAWPDYDREAFLTELDAALDAAPWSSHRPRTYLSDERKPDNRTYYGWRVAREAERHREGAPCAAPPVGRSPLAEAVAGVREHVFAFVREAVLRARLEQQDRECNILRRAGFEPPGEGRLEDAQSTDDLLPTAAAPARRALLRSDMGVGKTEAVLDAIACAMRGELDPVLRGYQPVGRGFRTLYVAPTHKLAEDIRHRAVDKDIRAVVWHGFKRVIDGEPVCYHAEDMERLAKAGEKAIGRCGSREHGFCPFHPEGSNAATCFYWQQRDALPDADLVLVAGNSALSRMPNEPTWRPNRRIDLVAPDGSAVHGEDGDDRPPFDLVVFDEPQIQALLAGFGTETIVAPNLTEIAQEQYPEPTPTDPFRSLPFLLGRRIASAVLGAVLETEDPLTANTLRAAILACSPLPRLDAPRVVDRALEWLEDGILPVGGRMQPAAPDALSAAEGVLRRNQAVRGLMDALRAARQALGATSRQDHPLPHFERVERGGTAAVCVRYCRPVEERYLDASVLLLDATAEVALWRHQNVLPGLQVLEAPGVALPPAVRRRQVFIGDDLSHSKLLAADVWAERVGRLAIVRAAEFEGQGAGACDVLLVMPQKLEARVREWLAAVRCELPRVGMEHFNNLRGVDRYAGVRYVAIIGRPLPSAATVEAMSAVLTGSYGVRLGGPYPTRSVPVAKRDGTGRLRTWHWHPDPYSEAFRRLICEAEVAQCEARARGLRRTDDTPLLVDLLTESPVQGLPVDEFFSLQVMLDGLDDAAVLAARGEVPTGWGAWGRIAKLVGTETVDAAKKRAHRKGAAGDRLRWVQAVAAGEDPPEPPSVDATLRTLVQRRWAPVQGEYAGLEALEKANDQVPGKSGQRLYMDPYIGVVPISAAAVVCSPTAPSAAPSPFAAALAEAWKSGAAGLPRARRGGAPEDRLWTKTTVTAVLRACGVAGVSMRRAREAPPVTELSADDLRLARRALAIEPKADLLPLAVPGSPARAALAALVDPAARAALLPPRSPSVPSVAAPTASVQRGMNVEERQRLVSARRMLGVGPVQYDRAVKQVSKEAARRGLQLPPREAELRGLFLLAHAAGRTEDVKRALLQPT